MNTRTVIALAAVVALLLMVPFASSAAPNDPLFSKQWGLAKIQAESAWNITKGAGVKIAIVDTGVHLTHPDLAANVIAGRDFVNNDSDPQDDDESAGHGTHVAGIAAAVSGNSIGVAGVAPGAKILPVKVLDSDGSGSAGDIANGIRYAADQKAGVINLSLSEQVPLTELRSPAVDDAIRYAVSEGVVVVAAAGNDAFPFANRDTANLILMVGASTRGDRQAAYSNSGEGVRLWAPGGDVTDVLLCEWNENIWSTILPGADLDCEGDGAITGYDTLSGTSMAAPHAAGAAALVRAANPSLSNAQVIDTLINNADTISGGLKRLNASKAVSAAKASAPSTSGQGTGSSGTPGGGATPSGSKTSSGGATSPAPGPQTSANNQPAQKAPGEQQGTDEVKGSEATGTASESGNGPKSKINWVMLTLAIFTIGIGVYPILRMLPSLFKEP